MKSYLVNIRLTLAEGITKVAQTTVVARNPNDAKLLLECLYGVGNVLSNPIAFPGQI